MLLAVYHVSIATIYMIISAMHVLLGVGYVLIASVISACLPISLSRAAVVC